MSGRAIIASATEKGDTMIDHVTANVSDFEQAKGFYEQVLAPLRNADRIGL